MNEGALGLPSDQPIAAVAARNFASGQYYTNGTLTTGTGNLSFGSIFISPFPVGRRTVFDRIGIEVTSGVATAVARLGIYADTGDGMPGLLLLEAGLVDASSNGQKDITLAFAAGPGLIWLAAQMEVATAQWRRCITTMGGLYIREQATDGTAVNTGYTKTGQGATPLPPDYRALGAPATTALMPRMFLRAA